MKFEWETIKNLPSCKTYRAKVIGGWIVQNNTLIHPETRESAMTESMVFIPDYTHKWEIS